MGDITCAKCGEPWDSYGVRHGDMDEEEAERFLKGEGCPSCHFATQCTHCGGTGKEPECYSDCRCFGDRKIRIWKANPNDAQWRHGYTPNVRVIADPKNIRDRATIEHRDGFGVEAWCDCPDCGDDAPECDVCHGTGQFQAKRGILAQRVEERFMRSALDETDDPDTQLELWEGTL